MGELYKMKISGYLFIVCVLGLPAFAFGQGHCSLQVSVVNAEGLEVEASVQVTEEDGRIVKKENQIGGVQFCDLGITPVMVTVGGEDACNGVTVHNVKLLWEKTNFVKVIYDRETCLYDPPASTVPLCMVLLRIKDAKGNWLSGSSVTVNAPNQESFTTDQYGRVILRARYGSDLEGVVKQEGYSLQKFKFSCSGDEAQQEHYIVLEELPK